MQNEALVKHIYMSLVFLIIVLVAGLFVWWALGFLGLSYSEWVKISAVVMMFLNLANQMKSIEEKVQAKIDELRKEANGER